MALAYSALGEQKIALECLDKALLIDPIYATAQQNRKIIAQLEEGEKSFFQTEEISYYKEKLESEGHTRKKPRKMSWSKSQSAYLHVADLMT